MTTVYNQAVKIQQDVIADPNNSSTTNLEQAVNSRTFTGTKTSTLGIALIQVSLFATQNCIIQVQQSPDTTPHWDVSDTFYYTASSTNGSWDTRAVNSYVRVVVTSLVDTTTFRLQTALCPIGDPQPRALDPLGNFKVTLQPDRFGNPIENSTLGEMQVTQRIRLVGTQFDGNTLDTNFWSTAASTGTIAQANSNITLTSGTANGHYASLWSNRLARFVTGTSNKYRTHIRLADTGTTNVKRRWGIGRVSNYLFTVSGTPNVVAGDIYTNNSQQFTVGISGTGVSTFSAIGTGAPAASGTLTQIVGSGGNLTFTAFAAQAVIVDGAYFELDGTTFSIVTCKGGSETRVSSGSFNGQYGYTYAPTTNNTIYEIAYGNGSVTFIIAQVPLHKVTASAATWTNTIHLNIFADVNNSGASSAVAMYSRAMNITRIGELETAPFWKYESGNVTAAVLKRGPGRLHKVVNTDSTGSIALYDGYSAINQIAAIDCTKVFGPQDFDLDFYNGLCYTTTGSPKVTIVYE